MKHIKNVLIKFLHNNFWRFFLIILLFSFLVIISPYLKYGDKGYTYFYLKPYFLQLFGSKESMWVFLAFFIIPLQEIYKKISDKDNLHSDMENAKSGLLNEMCCNMDSIFSNNVDKPISFYWYEHINNDLVPNFSKRGELLWKDFVDLYKEIIYYQNLVRVYFWNKQVDIAEYQFTIQSKFAKFIDWTTGLETLKDFPSQNYKKIGRDTLSKVYPEKKTFGLEKLKLKIDDLFC